MPNAVKVMVVCVYSTCVVLLPSSLLTTLVPATSPELPLKVIFLPLGSMADLATRGKYHKRFHLAYFSNRWVGSGGLGVVLAALDSYQTHTQSTLCSVYILYVHIYVQTV